MHKLRVVPAASAAVASARRSVAAALAPTFALSTGAAHAAAATSARTVATWPRLLRRALRPVRKLVDASVLLPRSSIRLLQEARQAVQPVPPIAKGR